MVKAEKRFSDEELPTKMYGTRCGGLSDVFVCMRGDKGGIRMHTNTEQRRRSNQIPTMVLAQSPKTFTKYILPQLPHLDANFSLLGNYRQLFEK